MAMEYYSFERVLKELQMEENELKRLVSEGEIRAFRDEDKMKFKKSDIDGLKKGRMTEPTIILPSGEPDDSSEDSEVLLVEEDTSETLLDIDDFDGADSSSTSVPTVDFTESDFDDPISGSETITEELTFEEDSGSYVLESSDDVLIDSSDELAAIDDAPSGETFIDSDTGLQTEPLDMDSVDLDLDLDIDSDSHPALDEAPMDEDTAIPETATPAPVPMAPIAIPEEPLSTGLMFCVVAASILLLFSGMFMINNMKEIDTPVTGVVTDIVYKIAPAKHLQEEIKFRRTKIKSSVSAGSLSKHMSKRDRWRKKPGSLRK